MQDHSYIEVTVLWNSTLNAILGTTYMKSINKQYIPHEVPQEIL